MQSHSLVLTVLCGIKGGIFATLRGEVREGQSGYSSCRLGNYTVLTAEGRMRVGMAVLGQRGREAEAVTDG